MKLRAKVSYVRQHRDGYKSPGGLPLPWRFVPSSRRILDGDEWDSPMRCRAAVRLRKSKRRVYRRCKRKRMFLGRYCYGHAPRLSLARIMHERRKRFDELPLA